MRRAARADDNQPEIVKAFRKMGATWQHTHAIPGALDGILGFHGIDVRVEIKDGSKIKSKQKLTDKEAETIEAWKGREPEIVKSIDDAILLMNRLRTERESLNCN
jgi:hypothetical protein